MHKVLLPKQNQEIMTPLSMFSPIANTFDPDVTTPTRPRRTFISAGKGVHCPVKRQDLDKSKLLKKCEIKTGKSKLIFLLYKLISDSKRNIFSKLKML